MSPEVLRIMRSQHFPSCTLALFPIFAAAFLLLGIAARAGDFEAGNGSYDAGKFATAKESFQRMVARGEWSSNLFYNLGNAEFRLGEKGLAALNYERALALEPGHPEATANLRLAREQAGSRLTERTWQDGLFPRWPADFFAIMGVAAATLFLAGLVLATMRGATGGLVLGLCACLILGTYSSVALSRDRREAALAVVIAKQVEARLAPADRAGVAEALPAGSRVKIKSERGEWTYCELPGNGLGWLPAGTFERIRLSR